VPLYVHAFAVSLIGNKDRSDVSQTRDRHFDFDAVSTAVASERNGQTLGATAMTMSDRTATVSRETAETTIDLSFAVDGAGEAAVDTGVGFFDHMLESFAKHGLFDLEVACDGDLHIDDHHTVEDVAIVLGQAFDEALGEKKGIVRYADRRVPLDEAVASVVVDVSGRPHFEFRGEFSQARVGDFTSDMARHFAYSLAMNAGLTLHAEIERGENAHHEVEALFKALARALDDATRIDERRADETPSTKGAL
jgi:imidazoleglycerol-phosphate dehydratase